MSQFEKLPADQEGYLDFTGWTLEQVDRVAPRYGHQGRSNFIFDEASGALVVRPERIMSAGRFSPFGPLGINFHKPFGKTIGLRDVRSQSSNRCDGHIDPLVS